ncbi:hypothetical protein HNR42_003335 [Deinobacterium chartae]|uniref:Uncharacterized protein n=1 Tax=Deinobacterium chartae TaxID=521158 RepID=A0A841I7U1_9DEIO|nr:hypothetical protein [Deinobacterium chartae]MBB6099875.1 hypothetical protein [Deinobacterium chartae]
MRTSRWISLFAVLACGSMASAAEFTIDATKGPNDLDQLARNASNDPAAANKAQVTQTVSLKLPYATGLHLDTTNLAFDISKLKEQDNTWVCVTGPSDEDVVTSLGPDFWNQKNTLPLGTSYTADAQNWPKIKVMGTGKVTEYPAGQLAGGELVPGSKGHFVCYRSFILQKFSNYGNFKLEVTRDGVTPSSTPGNPGGNQGIQNLYIQDNPCYSFGQQTGLYKLDPGATVNLIPKSLGKGTTGALAAKNPKNCGIKSWLDDLVVVAVKIDGELAGVNSTKLTYTLTSATTAF